VTLTRYEEQPKPFRLILWISSRTQDLPEQSQSLCGEAFSPFLVAKMQLERLQLYQLPQTILLNFRTVLDDASRLIIDEMMIIFIFMYTKRAGRTRTENNRCKLSKFTINLNRADRSGTK
jgi:hypothetical protein